MSSLACRSPFSMLDALLKACGSELCVRVCART